jgi:hypothetical protein
MTAGADTAYNRTAPGAEATERNRKNPVALRNITLFRGSPETNPDRIMQATSKGIYTKGTIRWIRRNAGI